MLAIITDNIGMAADSVWAHTVSTSDYYPFGLEMQGRTWHDTTTYTIVRDTVQRISYEALTQCDFEDGDACGWTVEAGGTLTTAETTEGGVMQFTVAACGEDCPGSISATKALTTEAGKEYRITLSLDLGDAERVIVSVRGDGDDGDEELASVEYTQDNLPENGEASLFFTANGATSTLYVTHGAPEAVVDADVVIFDDVEVEQVVLTEAVELRAVDGYRYGFNGMEKNQDGEFGSGTTYTTLFRQYDARIGRWLSADPLAKNFPWQSPYVGMDNKPIIRNDVNGDCPTCGAAAAGAVVGALMDMIIQVGEHMYDGDDIQTAIQKIDYVSVSKEAAIGALAGLSGFGAARYMKKAVRVLKSPAGKAALTFLAEIGVDMAVSQLSEWGYEASGLEGRLYSMLGVENPKASIGSTGSDAVPWYTLINQTGTEGEKSTLNELKKLYPNAKIAEQVTGDVFDKSGKKLANGIIFDFVVHDGKGGVLSVVESKASTIESFKITSPGQKGVFVEGLHFRLRGNNAAAALLDGFSSKGKNIVRQVSETAVKNRSAVKTLIKKVF